MTQRRVPTVLTTIAVVFFFSVSPTLAKKQRRQPCPGGRFLVQGSPLTVGEVTAEAQAIVVTGSRVSLAGGCGPSRAKIQARKKFTRVIAKWRGCNGVTGKAVIKARIDGATCDTMTGVFEAKRSTVKRRFTGVRSRCGDGFVDAGSGEQCDPAVGGCAGDALCAPDTCACEGLEEQMPLDDAPAGSGNPPDQPQAPSSDHGPSTRPPVGTLPSPQAPGPGARPPVGTPPGAQPPTPSPPPPMPPPSFPPPVDGPPVIPPIEPRPPKNRYTLTVAKNGSGTVTGQGIHCGTDCTGEYDEDAAVVLTAVPASGWNFEQWTNCENVSGTTCRLTMSSDRQVTATFRQALPETTVYLRVLNDTYFDIGSLKINGNEVLPPGRYLPVTERAPIVYGQLTTCNEAVLGLKNLNVTIDVGVLSNWDSVDDRRASFSVKGFVHCGSTSPEAPMDIRFLLTFNDFLTDGHPRASFRSASALGNSYARLVFNNNGTGALYYADCGAVMNLDYNCLRNPDSHYYLVRNFTYNGSLGDPNDMNNAYPVSIPFSSSIGDMTFDPQHGDVRFGVDRDGNGYLDYNPSFVRE